MDVQDNNTSNKINYLFEIYNRQHYFIDRHDAMAEKFMNVLLVEVTCISIIYTFIWNSINNMSLTKIQIASVIIFATVFIVALVHLLLIVQPQSKKAKRQNNEALLNNENKKWITESLIYYQGIINRANCAQSNNKVPFNEYSLSINDEELEKDLIQQIFILSQYSKYKKRKLETAIWLIIGTTLAGFLSIILLVLL